MSNNIRGKTLTMFAVLILILLVSSTSIGFFLYNKELQHRQRLEADLQTSLNTEMKLQADLKEARRQLTVAQDKAKEADDKINNLMDEMDLNESLRKELKKETASVKEAMAAAQKERDKMKAGIDLAERRYKEAADLLKAEQEKSNILQASIQKLQEERAQAQAQIEQLKSDLKPYNQRTPEQQVAPEVIAPGKTDRPKVNLDKIVVDPDSETRGRILSVDKAAEFIVCNLGLKQGIKTGDVLSVYRGDEYLGDVRVSRVQDELSAADIIPPFSSRQVRKNDAVVFRP